MTTEVVLYPERYREVVRDWAAFRRRGYQPPDHLYSRRVLVLDPAGRDNVECRRASGAASCPCGLLYYQHQKFQFGQDESALRLTRLCSGEFVKL